MPLPPRHVVTGPARHWLLRQSGLWALSTRPALVTSGPLSDKRTRINHALSALKSGQTAAPLLSTRGIYLAPCREPRRCRKVRPALGDGDRPPYRGGPVSPGKETRVHVSVNPKQFLNSSNQFLDDSIPERL